VRNYFANKIVHCGNRKCVVGLGDNVFKVEDSWKDVSRSGSLLTDNG
jgi:hypothetical protein